MDAQWIYNRPLTRYVKCMPGSLARCFLWNRWRRKRSRHSRCMRNPKFYVPGKRPIMILICRPLLIILRLQRLANLSCICILVPRMYVYKSPFCGSIWDTEVLERRKEIWYASPLFYFHHVNAICMPLMLKDGMSFLWLGFWDTISSKI